MRCAGAPLPGRAPATCQRERARDRRPDVPARTHPVDGPDDALPVRLDLAAAPGVAPRSGDGTERGDALRWSGRGAR